MNTSIAKVALSPARIAPSGLLAPPGSHPTLRRLFGADRRHHRRVWVGEERAHVEVRGLDRDEVASAVRARLEGLPGIDWVWAPGPLGRVVVAAQPGRLDVEAVILAVVEVEQAHGVQSQPFPASMREHPGDLQPLQRQMVALAADAAAAGFSLVGRVAQLTPVPVELVSFVSIVDAVPRLRSLVARLLGWPVTEVSLALVNAVSAALTHGGFGLVIDVAHRSGQLAEQRARRQLWVQREAQLCAGKGAPQAHRPVEARPRPLPPGPVERAADRLLLTSLGAAGVTWAVTSTPTRASQVMLAGLPRAAARQGGLRGATGTRPGRARRVGARPGGPAPPGPHRHGHRGCACPAHRLQRLG